MTVAKKGNVNDACADDYSSLPILCLTQCHVFLMRLFLAQIFQHTPHVFCLYHVVHIIHPVYDCISFQNILHTPFMSFLIISVYTLMFFHHIGYVPHFLFQYMIYYVSPYCNDL